LDLVNGKKLDAYAVMRVVDLAKGEIIGRQHAAARYKIRPVTLTSDLADLTEDIRRSLNELAKNGLKDLNLL
jgi:hypothetical protein